MSPAVRRILIVLGFVLMVPVAFFYAAGGLVVPMPALFGLWMLWVGLVVVQIVMRKRLWVVLAIPFLAVGLLILVVSIGEAFLGWTG